MPAGMKAYYSKSYKRQLRNETPEKKQQRLQRGRERQKERLKNETLLEREERLARQRGRTVSSRNRRRRESTEARDKRLGKKRLQNATQRSEKQGEATSINLLLQTESTYETNCEIAIRDQLHQRQPKVLRLSASTVKHTNIPPKSTDNSYNDSVSQRTVPMPFYSCPMEDELNNEEGTILEPKVVIEELNAFPNPEPMVTGSVNNIKVEPMTNEPDEPEMIVGIRFDSSFPEPMISETDKNVEPMVSETDSIPKSQCMDTNASPEVLKNELIIKSEVYIEEL